MNNTPKIIHTAHDGPGYGGVIVKAEVHAGAWMVTDFTLPAAGRVRTGCTKPEAEALVAAALAAFRCAR